MLRYRRLGLKIENKEERKRLYTLSNEKHHIVSIRKKSEKDLQSVNASGDLKCT